MLSAVCFTRPHGLTKRSYLLVSTRQHLLSLCSRTLLVMYGQALTTKHMPQVSTRVKLLLCLSIPRRAALFQRRQLRRAHHSVSRLWRLQRQARRPRLGTRRVALPGARRVVHRPYR
jgi:hypothetical protein